MHELLPCAASILWVMLILLTTTKGDPIVMHARSSAAGLNVAKMTGNAMSKGAPLLKSLPVSRLHMEVNALFSYGSAADSLRILWRYDCLDMLCPPLAWRFQKAKVPR